MEKEMLFGEKNKNQELPRLNMRGQLKEEVDLW